MTARALACAALLCAACEPTTISGSLAFHDDAGKAWSFRPMFCESGDTREFYGADLSDGVSVVRLFQDPAFGWMITFMRNGNLSMPDERIDLKTPCARFDVGLSYDRCTRCGKNDTDEDDSTMSGHLDIDCPFATSAHVDGRIDFQYCNNPGEP
jgi:hypothetical protein